MFQGVATVPVWVNRGSLRLPADPASGIICVGPGTGVAPLRSFIQYRRVLRLPSVEGGDSAHVGPSSLYFGCRNENCDFFFAQEWAAYVSDGTLSELHCAFSRDGTDTHGNKIYVQTKIRQSAMSIWRLLSEFGATIYVAGNAKNMPAAVRRAFVDAVAEGGEMSKDDAEAYVRMLEKNSRYQTETWA
eukprot:SAG31_NODE_1828_length_7159_cov_58.418980_2_plen_188_part_00